MQDLAVTPVQIRTILYMIRKHKWKISAVFLVSVIAVTISTLMATPIYRASSKLLVKAGREDIYVSPATSSPAVVDRLRDGGRVGAEIAILKNLNLVVDFVDRFGVGALYDYPDRTLKGKLFKENREREIPSVRQAQKSVLRNLEVSSVPNSNVFNVGFTWPDPVIAADVVNQLVDLYLVKHLEVHTNPQTYALLRQQAENWEKKLREAENRVEIYKRRHSITSLPEQRTILLGRLSEAESQRRQTENEIQETLQMVATLETQLSNLEQNVQLQQRVDQQSEALADLKAKLVDLELQGLKDEISRVKEMIAEEETKKQVVVVSGKSPVRENLESDLVKAKATLGALKAKERNQRYQIGSYERDLLALEGLEKEMNELTRQVEITEENYKLYLTKFEEAKISESMDEQRIANVRVIAPAVPIMQPIKPNKKLNVLAGGFLGLLTGIGIAFLIEFINPVYRTREDVDQFLGLPVLAILPKEKTA
ncbi:MAG: hypothetical protein GTO24_09935 [candidate division Zixibacteria bacterium]|nr:hypothetical protein [candidate division Zixibacteria bacterium]